MKVLHKTESLCPMCVEEKKWNKMKIPATIYEENGKVWIKKKCSEHGETKGLYWGDYELYKRAERFQDPKGLKPENPFVTKSEKDVNCPLDCGLCYKHMSHTNLANVVVTNRCNLACWYCFFYVKKGDPVYEPSLDQLRKMFETIKNQKPVGCNAVQLTGGEPTIREDLVDVIKMAKEVGFDHVQPNVNAIEIARNPDLAKKLVDAGANVFYVSFDGTTPQTNPKNYYEIPDAMENFRKTVAGVVLVPTVIGGVNDNQLGDIIRFAAGNIDVIRGIDFQPVSLVGMMPKKEREKQRITIPDVIKKIEKQTDGQITPEDFYPIPCATKITDFISFLKGGGPRYRLSSHFACGAATYVFKDGEKFVPITRFIDIEGFFEYLDKEIEALRAGKSKTIAKAKLLFALNKFIDRKKKPKDLKISKIIFGALRGGSYDSLREFHHKSLFIGLMHFQDPWNYDVERVKRCVIHYATPDGRIIPFCAFNVIPALYRDKIQKKYSVPHKEWEKRTGRKIDDDKYIRKISSEKKREVDAYYSQYK